jgi:guanosine-3',5'-bis(diphosphate) 3'-pyrophosphohydrolase
MARRSPVLDGATLVVRALGFAAEAHRTQFRKDRETPAINHPIRLLQLLVDAGGVTDPTVLAAAALHDVLEDCEVDFPELEARFGTEVAGVVFEMSDPPHLDKAAMRAWQVETAPRLSPAARLVKLADKTVNLNDLMDWPPTGWSDRRKASYFEWALEVVAGIRGTNAALEAAFDAAYDRRPKLVGDVAQDPT